MMYRKFLEFYARIVALIFSFVLWILARGVSLLLYNILPKPILTDFVR
ncbi:hypothetical protein [Helicobacter equorum]